MENMKSDSEYIPNYMPDTLYMIPGEKGAYARVVSSQDEVVIGEIEVTPRSRLAVSAFYVNEKDDYDSFKVVKLTWHKTYGWRVDSEVAINGLDCIKIREFLSLLALIDLTDTKKTKISLHNVQINGLSTLLNSSQSEVLLQQLSKSPDLPRDIYAIESKRKALAEFKCKLSEGVKEPEWQEFFENNQWIFGYGLNYVALQKVSKKLETITTGSAYDQKGKRADALMRTRAEVSQFMLVEIKKSETLLLKNKPYRPGCWGMSEELSSAVSQVQKTVFDFSRNHFRDSLKDQEGNNLSEQVYAIEPHSFLIIGNLKEISGNDDKVTCFELYRKNIKIPEIITFDELFYRAEAIVSNISNS